MGRDLLGWGWCPTWESRRGGGRGETPALDSEGTCPQPHVQTQDLTLTHLGLRTSDTHKERAPCLRQARGQSLRPKPPSALDSSLSDPVNFTFRIYLGLELSHPTAHTLASPCGCPSGQVFRSRSVIARGLSVATHALPDRLWPTGLLPSPSLRPQGLCTCCSRGRTGTPLPALHDFLLK